MTRETAIAEVRSLMEEKGHSVDVARRVAARLEAAFAVGELRRTPPLEAMLADLAAALDTGAADGTVGGGPGAGGKLGGKSGEAARFILRAISRSLDAA